MAIDLWSNLSAHIKKRKNSISINIPRTRMPTLYTTQQTNINGDSDVAKVKLSGDQAILRTIANSIVNAEKDGIDINSYNIEGVPEHLQMKADMIKEGALPENQGIDYYDDTIRQIALEDYEKDANYEGSYGQWWFEHHSDYGRTVSGDFDNVFKFKEINNVNDLSSWKDFLVTELER